MSKPTAKDVDPRDRAVGQRVAALRKHRDLTQADLAARLEKKSSWMSQVERGIQPVRRVDVLQEIADALGVSVQDLNPSAPSPQTFTPPAEDARVNDLDGTRLLISGHPALRTLLGLPDEGEQVPPLDDLKAAVEEIWALTHTARFDEISAKVTAVLPMLEMTVRTAPEDQRPTAYVLLARTYQALAAALVRQNEADAAWVAADRAIWAAERSDQILHVFAGVFRMVQAFVRLGHRDQAQHAANQAIDALSQRTDLGSEGVAVLGSLHLVRALVHARSSQRAEARADIQQARELAQRLDDTENHFNLEFSAAGVEIQAVSTAVDLGDAGEALDIGLTIDASALSPERQGRLLMDLGRAYAQRRHPGEAVRCLLRAEELAPQTVRTHKAARDAIRELVLIYGAKPPADLMDLARRADAMA